MGQTASTSASTSHCSSDRFRTAGHPAPPDQWSDTGFQPADNVLGFMDAVGGAGQASERYSATMGTASLWVTRRKPHALSGPCDARTFTTLTVPLARA